jgi:site-specific DNA-methyltransferase (adenine-specific)
MKPYYADDAVTIYHGDVLETLAQLRMEHLDLVVTSPPYNLGKPSGAYANMRDGYLSHDDSMEDAEYVRWQQSVLACLWDSLSPGGAIFYNHKPLQRDGVAVLPTRLVPDGVLLRQVIVWDRGVGFNWSPSHFVPQHEWIMLLATPEFRLKSRGASSPGDVWRVPIEQTDFGHPCPFPVSLAARAIGATDAQYILDPFVGAGATLVAAKALGRKAIGIEIEERYCEIAARRCSQEVLGLSA